MSQLEAVFRKEAGQLDYTPSADRTAGEILKMEDGRAGVMCTDLVSGRLGAVYTCGIFDVAAASGTTFYAGERVYWDVSASLAVNAASATGAGDFCIGIATAAKVSGTLVVRTELNPDVPSFILGLILADGTAVSNTTTETISASIQIPKEELVAGAVFEVDAFFIATATNSTDTFQFKLRLGGVSGTVLVQSTAVDLADNDTCHLRAQFTVLTSGSSGTMEGHGSGVNKTTACQGGNTAALDTTADSSVAATITESVASASNSAKCRSLTVKRIR